MCKLPTLSETSTPSQRLKAFYNIDSEVDKKFRKDIDVFDSEEQKDNFIFNVWVGSVSVTNLDVGLYVRTAKLYEKAIDSIGYAKRLSFYTEFKRSVWTFSAAKNFRQTVEMNLLLRGDDGKIKPYAQFRKDVDPIVKRFGKDYTRAEYNLAVANTQSAVQWDTIQKDKHIFPSLRYITTGDSRVREEHAALDNTIKPVDDPFWDTYMPPNGWNCRCSVQQITARIKTPTAKLNPVEINNSIKLESMFQNNPGRSRKIFTQQHPYFDVPKNLESFKKSNFGLPLPAELFTDG